jgi:hypothetical protein
MTLDLSRNARKLIVDSSVTVRRDSLRSIIVTAMLRLMKRELIALILMIAIGLQGSMAAFASTSPLMSADCQTTAMAHSDASQDSCCPKGQHAMSCCLDLCLSTVGATASPIVLTIFTAPADLQVATSSIFSSRGDSPLIRPPIL